MTETKVLTRKLGDENGSRITMLLYLRIGHMAGHPQLHLHGLKISLDE